MLKQRQQQRHRSRESEHLPIFYVHPGRAPIRCELRFHGESVGYEVQFFERDGFSFYAHGGFVTKAVAVRGGRSGTEGDRGI
jgi:hypothetical protein